LPFGGLLPGQYDLGFAEPDDAVIAVALVREVRVVWIEEAGESVYKPAAAAAAADEDCSCDCWDPDADEEGAGSSPISKAQLIAL
jgi:hypothetical protein